MLPDPKKVARFLRSTVFKSAEERRQEAEYERDVKLRMAKTRIQRHINQQNDHHNRLVALAKRALTINDKGRFRHIARMIMWAREDIQRWEKYLLFLEVLEARRGQVRSAVDLLESMKTISESLIELSEPQRVSELQRELEKGLANAANIEERIAVMLEAMDATLFSEMSVNEAELQKLENTLVNEIAAQEAAAFDADIETQLSRIRQELEDEEKQ